MVSESFLVSRSEAQLVSRACLTFTDVPFGVGKPDLTPKKVAFLDTLRESIHATQAGLGDPNALRDLSVSLAELNDLADVFDSILAEYRDAGSCGDELELLVGERHRVLEFRERLQQFIGAGPGTAG